MNLFTLIFKNLDNKNYFYFIILFIILFIFGLFFSISNAYKNGYKDPEIELLNYQLEKLDDLDLEVIFLGDSSLGNFIDAKTWSDLSGKNTANLALTGKFQYKGNFAMLKKIIEKNDKVKINIISTTMNWSYSEKNLFNTVYYNNNPIIKNYYLTLFNLNRVSIKKIINFYLNKKIEYNSYIYNDYVLQGEIINDENLDISFTQSIVDEKKLKSLIKLKRFCEEKNLDCKLFHGPITKKICDLKKFNEYMKNLNNFLNKNNLIFEKELICFDQRHIGDSEDHINLIYKKSYTKIFYDLIFN